MVFYEILVLLMPGVVDSEPHESVLVWLPPWLHIRIRFEVKSWIRIRIEANADQQHSISH